MVQIVCAIHMLACDAHSHSVLIGSVFGLSHTVAPLQPRLPILLHYSVQWYTVLGSLECSGSYQELFHGSYSLHMFFPTSHLL